MSDQENKDFSYHDVTKKHFDLLKSISKIDKNLIRADKPVKSEPTFEITEFHLKKSEISNRDVIKIKELTKTLNGKSHKHQPSKEINFTKFLCAVPKPLEKLTTNKLTRQSGFQTTQNNLNKWSSVITKNRVLENLIFPLKQTSVKRNPTDEFIERFKIKSKLEEKFETLEPNKKIESKVITDEFPLTLEEILVKTNETAKFRAQQTYKGIKNYRQKQIKSKSFHKHKKREKIKQQLKDFDELRRVNSEAALKKLQQLDKARAEERMSLKHKNTSSWAKNKQIRARYDKQSRQLLAQQLSIGRSLTEKHYKDDNYNDNEYNTVELIESAYSPSEENHWLNEKRESSIDTFITKYRKYWNEKNEITKIIKPIDFTNTKKNIGVSNNNALYSSSLDSIKKLIGNNSTNTNIKNEKIFKNSIQLLLTKKQKMKHKNYNKGSAETIDFPLKSKTKSISNKKIKINLTKKNVGTTEWSVESINVNNTPKKFLLSSTPSVMSIDAIFDTAEDNINTKNDAKKLQRINAIKKKILFKKANVQINEDNQLLMKKKIPHPEIDKPLNEMLTKNEVNQINNLFIFKSNDLQSSSLKKNSIEINPKNYINTKSKFINIHFFDDTSKYESEDLNNSSEDQENCQGRAISEAFADDDVIEEFVKEKQAEIDQLQIRHLDGSFAGWGCWAGRSMKIIRHRKPRFIKKYPLILKKKNENEDIIITENDENKLKTHQVGDIPYPFNSTTDFESSVRVPYGRNFIPENSHRCLIQPSFTTKIGNIIDPMDLNVLIKKNTS